MKTTITLLIALTSTLALATPECSLKVSRSTNGMDFKDTVFKLKTVDGVHFGDQSRSYAGYGLRLWVDQNQNTYSAQLFRTKDKVQANGSGLSLDAESGIYLDKQFAGSSSPSGSVQEFAFINCKN